VKPLPEADGSPFARSFACSLIGPGYLPGDRRPKERRGLAHSLLPYYFSLASEGASLSTLSIDRC